MNTKRTKKDASGRADAAPVKPVYKADNPGLKAECIYLYYLTPTADPNHLKIEVYFEDRKKHIPRTQIENIIREMVYKIINGSISPCGWGVSDLTWRRRSYVAAVMNSSTRKMTKDDAIEFTYYDTAAVNHTFFDGADLSPFDNVTGVYCLNHMKKKDSSAWRHGDTPEQFKVTFKHEPRAPMTADRRSHEETGTNMGPPVPPP